MERRRQKEYTRAERRKGGKAGRGHGQANKPARAGETSLHAPTGKQGFIMSLTAIKPLETRVLE